MYRQVSVSSFSYADGVGMFTNMSNLGLGLLVVLDHTGPNYWLTGAAMADITKCRTGTSFPLNPRSFQAPIAAGDLQCLITLTLLRATGSSQYSPLESAKHRMYCWSARRDRWPVLAACFDGGAGQPNLNH